MVQKIILIVSNSEDAHADRVLERLGERGVPFCRLDSDRLITESHIWRISAIPGISSHNSWLIPEVEVVWYRKVYFPEGNDPIQSFIRQESEGLLEAILSRYHHCRWINPRDRLAQARSKIVQLERAKTFGLRIPDTLLTTDQTMLKAFVDQHGGEIVAKPLQSQVIGTGEGALVTGTRRLTPEHFAAALTGAPCYAQERLRIKSEVRVIVFGNEVFAVRQIPDRPVDDIKQLALKSIRHEPCTLEPVMVQKINALMASYGLAFGAIDLAIVDEDEPIFLELNPNGQWLWLQYVCGLNLLDPFIDFLVA